VSARRTARARVGAAPGAAPDLAPRRTVRARGIVAVARHPNTWIALLLLIVLAVVHYLTPQIRVLSTPVNAFLQRHAVERIAFVLPVAIASAAFQLRGGVPVLILSVLIMLPRAIWISPQPVDALLETGVAAAVGAAVSWAITVQDRERRLRQKAIARLHTINALATLVSRSLDVGQIMRAALDQALLGTGLGDGLMFSSTDRTLLLGAHRGVGLDTARALARMDAPSGALGGAVRSGEVIVAEVGDQAPAVLREEGWLRLVAIPLRSKGQVRGLMVLGARHTRAFPAEELDLLAAIGLEIGVALENAALYERTRSYARQIIAAQEAERQRIARELHDETIQALIVLARRLDALERPSSQEPAVSAARLAPLRELIGELSRGMRRIVRDLRPSTLDHLGLVAAVRGLVGQLSAGPFVAAALEVEGTPRRLDPQAELALFRIAQEALHNALRHAGASTIVVRIAFAAGQVLLEVRDDGGGFAVPSPIDDHVASGRLGLAGMDERARGVGGALVVESTPGAGTVVRVTVPDGLS
jgi:signal transduction histidine kinase